MEVKYVTIPINRVRQDKEECYTSVAKGLILVGVGILRWVGMLAVMWGMTIRAFQLEPIQEKADAVIPLAVETPCVEMLSVDVTETHDMAETNKTNGNHTPLTDSEYAALLEVCEECQVDPSLALGLIEVESGFNGDALATSGSGCYGYCQLNPRYFPSGLSHEDNIRTGICYLAEQCK